MSIKMKMKAKCKLVDSHMFFLQLLVVYSSFVKSLD